MVVAVETKNGGTANAALTKDDVQKWKRDCRNIDNMYAATGENIEKVLMSSASGCFEFCNEVGRDESGLIVAGVVNDPSVTRDFIAAMTHATRNALNVRFAIEETAENRPRNSMRPLQSYARNTRACRYVC